MPVYTKQKKSVGTSGVAEVRPLKDSLRVIFKDGDQYQVSNEGWNYPAGHYQLTLNASNTEILFKQPPPSTTHLVKFTGFSNRGQADVPEPSIRRGGPRKSAHGGTYFAEDELVFVSKLEVVGGNYAGLQIPYSLTYCFEQYPGTQFTMLSAKAGRLQKIEDFLTVAGIDLVKDDIPFSDNVLPWLEKRLLEAGKIFQIKLNDKGFVDLVTEVPEFLLPPELTGKKSAKKAKAPKAKAKK